MKKTPFIVAGAMALLATNAVASGYGGYKEDIGYNYAQIKSQTSSGLDGGGRLSGFGAEGSISVSDAFFIRGNLSFRQEGNTTNSVFDEYQVGVGYRVDLEQKVPVDLVGEFGVHELEYSADDLRANLRGAYGQIGLRSTLGYLGFDGGISLSVKGYDAADMNRATIHLEGNYQFTPRIAVHGGIDISNHVSGLDDLGSYQSFNIGLRFYM